MRKRTRAALGTAVLSAAVILTAFKGEFGYLSIAATAVAFGIPEVIEMVKLYLSKDNDPPHCPD